MQQPTRRSLFRILPAGFAACCACSSGGLCTAQSPARPREHTPAEKCDMTWEEMFRFTYQENYIPTLRVLEKQIGKEKLVAMLKQGLSDAARSAMAKTPGDFAAWVNGMRKVPPLLQHALGYNVVEDSPTAFEIRVTECLWARIFREENAADIGYAGICHPDFAAATGFNPKIKLARTKTLMQGHECCDVRYTVEA